MKLNSEVTQLKSDLTVCRKRKQAQMTRLRRQLNEAQSRCRQWADELDRLNQSANKLKRKIEE